MMIPPAPRVLKAKRSKIKVPTDRVYDEGTFPGLLVLFLYPHMVGEQRKETSSLVPSLRALILFIRGPPS